MVVVFERDDEAGEDSEASSWLARKPKTLTR